MEIHSGGKSGIPKQPVVLLAAQEPDKGELGSVYSDAGKTISHWQGQVHDSLTDWLKIADEINTDLQNAVDRVNQDVKMYKWMIGEYQGMLKDQKNKPSMSFHYNFAPSWIHRISILFQDLGIPTSDIKYTKTQVNGKTMYNFTISQFGGMVDAAQQGLTQAITDGSLFAKLSALSGQISTLRSKQTKDMFLVMYAYQNVRMNEKTVSGIMKSLTQIFSNINQNIAR